MNNKEFHTVRGYQLMEHNSRLLTSAEEDYIEMIYRYSLKEGFVRINQLAELLHVRASSVSKMVQKLGGAGLLKYQKYGVIVLSTKGMELGEYLLERHQIIEKFLAFLGCGEDDLLLQTELIEHNMNAKTVEKLKVLYLFITEKQEIMEDYMKYKEQYTMKLSCIV